MLRCAMFSVLMSDGLGENMWTDVQIYSAFTFPTSLACWHGIFGGIPCQNA